MPEILAAAGCMSGQSCPRVTVLDSGDVHIVGRQPTDAEAAEAAAPVGFGEAAVVLSAAMWAKAVREQQARDSRALAVEAGEP